MASFFRFFSSVVVSPFFVVCVCVRLCLCVCVCCAFSVVRVPYVALHFFLVFLFSPSVPSFFSFFFRLLSTSTHAIHLSLSLSVCSSFVVFHSCVSACVRSFLCFPSMYLKLPLSVPPTSFLLCCASLFASSPSSLYATPRERKAVTDNENNSFSPPSPSTHDRKKNKKT